MQPATQPSLPVEQIGSWIPFAEVRPNLWLAQHAEIGGQVLFARYPGAADNAALRQQLILHNDLSRSGAGFAKVIELLISGGDLLAAIESAGQLLFTLPGPLRRDQITEIGADVARALGRMHASGRAHGALCTGSVLSGRPGAGAVLLDLGWGAPLGRPADGVNRSLSSLAPENMAGAALTPASDVWGLGALLYTLATNRSWDGSSATRHPGLDRQLAAAIDRCLCADPAHRLADSYEVIAALDGVGRPTLSLFDLDIEPEISPEPEIFSEPEILFDDLGDLDDRGPPLTEHEAWGEHAGWFIDDDVPLTEDQIIALYGFRPPMSAGARRALCVATTGAVLASSFGLALLGLEILG